MRCSYAILPTYRVYNREQSWNGFKVKKNYLFCVPFLLIHFEKKWYDYIVYTSYFNISTFSSFLSTRNSISEIMPIHHKTENNQSIKHSSIAIALINLNFGLFFLQLENSPCLTPSTCENGMNKYRDTEYLITLPIWCMVDGWLQIGCFEACYCFDGKCRYSHIDVKAFKKLHPFIWY